MPAVRLLLDLSMGKEEMRWLGDAATVRRRGNVA
jgi:hypothetical protein